MSAARTLALVDPGAGNLRSLERAIRAAADAAGLRVEIDLTAAPERVARADGVVMPGQGHFGDVRRSLDAAGLSEAIAEVKGAGRPLLGVCVGYQLFYEGSEEDGWTEGFGWLKGRMAIIEAKAGRKVPHMGWNALRAGAAHPVIDPLIGRHVYFAHSYVARLREEHRGSILAWTDYGEPIAAAAVAQNAVGVQFHPEKSQAAGLAFLRAFLEWRP